MAYASIDRATLGLAPVRDWIAPPLFSIGGVAVDAKPSPPPLPLPSRPFYIGKLSHSLKDGSATLNIGVPERGDLVVTAPGIGWKVNKGPTPPSYHHGSFTWRLKIWPGKTRFGKKIRTRLRNKGWAKVALRLTYTEEGQLPATRVKPLVLRQNKQQR
jgi:hypothetical protein